MGGLHLPDLIVVLLIALAIFGPKALQSMSRSAGKSMGQVKTMKDKVVSELPVEEISEVSRSIPRIPSIPSNPYQAAQMIMASGDDTPENKDSKQVQQETKKSNVQSDQR